MLNKRKVGLSYSSRRKVRGSMVAALLLGGLAGCGGSDEGGDSTGGSTPPSATTPPSSQITALDGFSAVRPGVATRVDLSAFVRGAGATLSSISSEQAGCSASNLSGLSAEVMSDDGLCEFTYKVSGQGSDASATLNTLASDKASPVIPPVSQTMTLAEPSKVFDLAALLGADWPAGYNLDPASLVVQGGSAQGTVTASGNVLTYTHPGEPVWNRILFTLKDPVRPDEDAFGALYVTVSDSANQPPAIGEPKYDYNAQVGAPVVVFQPVMLYLDTLRGLNITEPDGEEWQLVEVQSYTGDVNPIDPDSVTNKAFTFQAGTVGDHIVSYVVGDHEAGFAMGLIKITVSAAEGPKAWNNISIGDKTFRATPLYSEVTSRGVIAEAVYDDVVTNTVGGVTSEAAKTYCNNGSHLATFEELELLRTTPAAGTELAKYPVERTYVTYGSDGQPMTYELFTGVTGAYDPASSANQYVICVNEADMGYISRDTAYGVDTGLSDSSWWELGTLVSVGGAGEPMVTATTNIGATPLTEANVRLNPAGCPLSSCKVELVGDATTYGSVSVQVANAASPHKTLDIGPLTLLQSAMVSAASVGTDNSFADGGFANTVVVSVVDGTGAPLPDTAVKLQYSAPAGVTVSPASCADALSCAPVTTDSSGNITLSLTTATGGSHVLNLAANALQGGVPGTAVSVTSTFTPAPPNVEGCNPDGAGTGQVHTPGVGTFIATCSVMTWSAANDYCAGLGNGYRLPSKDELSALYRAYPSGVLDSSYDWPLTDFYWSSTEYVPGQHYNVHLYYQSISSSSDSNNHLVACVR